ncbi:hypothetical protein CsSME_00014712 [Camellia sinensis var. sinensis]
MEMERMIEFSHAYMDRRPRTRPRLGWDVAPQALKIRGRSGMRKGLCFYRSVNFMVDRVWKKVYYYSP